MEGTGQYEVSHCETCARSLWPHKCATMSAETPFLKDIDGKDVCVLGSGDNEVAFALAGLGGQVTSVKSNPLPWPGVIPSHG
jgi:hypothetical protein